MRSELPEPYQAKFLEATRKMYRIDPPSKFIADRVTEIERPIGGRPTKRSGSH